MLLSNEIEHVLSQRQGLSSPTPATASLTSVPGVELTIAFQAVDSMSCAIWELQLTVPHLAQADLKLLEQWSTDLCSRVSYLLEGMAAIELDPTLGSILVRSSAPTRTGPCGEYYEVFLQSQGADCFALRRYRFEAGRPGRTQVALTVTHEVLKRLVHDIIDTIPNRP
jgi:hypothetical protein